MFIQVHQSLHAPECISEYVKILQNKKLYKFLEYINWICEELKRLGSQPSESSNVDALLLSASRQREFKLSGGLEVATQFRDFYRSIGAYCFSDRDIALNRMKIFSAADMFRQWSSDGRLDSKGRDGNFKVFWEVGMEQPNNDVVEYDIRELEARTKDNDPSKEMKCSVIKSINDSGSEDLDRFADHRIRLRKMTDTKYTLSEVNKHDCENTELKLISIHGIIFDVTENLEKYAPDGEYFFFAGHDISYPLAVSALSGDFVDHLYKLTSVDHLKRVYGWMSYFENKYKVVGTLVEWDNEDSLPDPPQGEDEPEMQCSIM